MAQLVRDGPSRQPLVVMARLRRAAGPAGGADAPSSAFGLIPTGELWKPVGMTERSDPKTRAEGLSRLGLGQDQQTAGRWFGLLLALTSSASVIAVGTRGATRVSALVVGLPLLILLVLQIWRVRSVNRET